MYPKAFIKEIARPGKKFRKVHSDCNLSKKKPSHEKEWERGGGTAEAGVLAIINHFAF
jgi:hypothetical protein